MAVTLLLAPAAAGKTRAALDALRTPRRGRALLLVPDHRQQRQLKARLTGVPRVGVHQFDSLTRMLLRHAGIAVADLSGTMHTLLLRRVLRELDAAGAVPTFARVVHKPGFVANIGTLIAEAQDAGVTPQQLAAAAVTPYDTELGAIYAAYTTELEQRGLADIARRLELACTALQHNPRLPAGVQLLVVDGFDQFTPLQLQVLAQMTRYVEQTIITLTGSAEERPAQRRFDRTRRQIVAALHPDSIQVQAERESTADEREPVPAFLEQHLFNLDVPPPTDPGDTLTLIAAADREREVRAALRQVRVLLERGIPPEQIALLFRSGTAYLPLLREVAAEYALPLAIYAGRPLAEAPQVVANLTMLRLPLEDYPRRELVEVWRNLPDWRVTPNSEPDEVGEEPAENPAGDDSGPEQVEVTEGASATDVPHTAQSSVHTCAHAAGRLDRVARNAGIATGLERLRVALTALAAAEPPLEQDGAEYNPLTVDPTTAQTLLTRLDAFVAWLTPPAHATIGEYVAWVRERTTTGSAASADGERSTAQPTPPQLHSASARWSAVLDDLAQAAAVLDEPPVSYSAFVADLSAAVAAANYGRVEPGPAHVAAMPVLAARGICFDHTVLLGMAQGEFPLRFPDPPFYSRRERALLARQGIELTAPDPADERSLFYEIIGRTRRSLTLTRTYLDEQSNPLPPSPYLTALLDLVQSERVPTLWARAGSIPPPDEAASPQEALIAVMAAGDQHAQQSDQQPLPAHVRRACEVERGREDTGTYGFFEGVVEDPAVIAELAQRFGAGHQWSITQFNDYITCPFRFAAAHVLKLQPRSEPEDDLEHSTRGRIYHAILAEAGKTWMQTQHAHTSANEQDILTALQSAADAILAEAPTRYHFEPNAFWNWDQADIRRRLERALRRVLHDESDWADFRPAGVEQSFGRQGRNEPLRLDTPVGTALVAGRIDRLDQRDDGALALLDYKSSSTPRSLEETLNGRDVQLAIYLLAAEQILARGQRVERAAFLHLGSGKRSKPLTDRERDRALAAMTERVGETLAGVRAGHFAVRPRDNCPTACSFAGICRLNLAKRDAQDGD
jgi:ATP-dependent helicase/nuclease subunit B